MLESTARSIGWSILIVVIVIGFFVHPIAGMVFVGYGVAKLLGGKDNAKADNG